jgi:aminopeptidase N
MRRTLISAAVLGLATMLATPAQAAPAMAPVTATTTQLPRTARPTHYALSITPDAKAARFDARVTISIELLTASSSLTLNAAELSFTRAQLLPAGGKGAPLDARVTLDAKNETATFSFEQPLAKGNYRLQLDYSGKIGTQAEGLFSLDYDSAEGKQRALYTQFENSAARRMIPSWDEPGYKATFALEATVPAHDMAVSNMPIVTTTPLADGRQRVTFAQSPKMSTYLLFFGLGQFERATTMVDGTELGVITKKGVLAQAKFALDASAAVLREYNAYFGVRYPLPKLDNIAAPGRSNFFGAMENWGAILTFEYTMLLDPATSTQGDKQGAFTVAAHEMAHQWFGDLVTMDWWDELWLNEGFASWMEGRTTARLHPEWKSSIDAVGVRENAMGADSIATSHPVVQHVATVEQASQAFDSITYSKGQAVIGMLENYVGEKAWRSGVRAYMKAHAYGSTRSDDLWREVEKAAGKPITDIAHDFTLQAGVPLIRVESVDCVAGKSVVALTQGQFSRDQPDKKPLAWRVPVSVQLGVDGPVVRTLVTGGKAKVRLPGCGPVLVNAGQSGYYRTVYAPKAFAALAGQFARLAPIDQLGLLTDSWALGFAGLQPLSDFLDLAAATPLSAQPGVWSNITGAFGTIHAHYEADPARQQRFARFAIGRLAPLMNQLGWIARAGEAETVAPLRQQLIGALSDLGDVATIAEARRRFALRDSDPSALPPALRKIVTGVVARAADESTWNALRSSAQEEKSAMTKNRLYTLLAISKDEALAKRALALALTEEPGLTISPGMIGAVSGAHPDLAFDFALSNMDKVNGLVEANARASFIPQLGAGSADPAMIEKIKAYASANLAPGSRRGADSAVVRINYRIKVRAERLPEIDAWLARQKL